VIRLLIADDSALMRKLLEGIFIAEGDFDIRMARNGNEALELVRTFDPQVVTLDVQMPGMDGLTCLSRIMIEAPRPVVMISSLTAEGAEATLEAIELGAVDFIAKPVGRFHWRSIACDPCWWKRFEPHLAPGSGAPCG
jgi:two-component system chemotaxis response regulator CheB